MIPYSNSEDMQVMEFGFQASLTSTNPAQVSIQGFGYGSAIEMTLVNSPGRASYYVDDISLNTKPLPIGVPVVLEFIDNGQVTLAVQDQSYDPDLNKFSVLFRGENLHICI